MRTWLVDTGPLVAYLDGSDPAHDGVAKLLDGFTGVLVTTGAVITEAMHFLSADEDGPRTPWTSRMRRWSSSPRPSAPPTS
jgi:predicted nucleic acid-binding protein